MHPSTRRSLIAPTSMCLLLGWAAPASLAQQAEGQWFGLMDHLSGSVPASAKPAPERPLPPRHAVPLPVHTAEGVGGGWITPTAYLVNPGPEGTVVGAPAVSLGYYNLGHQKSIQTLAVTQTFWRRLELGYALSRADLGTLPNAISKIRGTPPGQNEVYLHNFNIRGVLVKEDSFGLPLPAITAGVHFKYNCSIRSIQNHLQQPALGGGLERIGFDKSNGVDYTLTASKTIEGVLPGPIILSLGLRNSSASHIGYAGFGDSCHWTLEGNATTFVTEWLAVTYEFRQKNDPYGDPARPGLLGDEDDWHGIGFALLLNEHLTLSGGVGFLGRIGNTEANGAWGLQLKYEF